MKLAYFGYLLTENGHGWTIDTPSRSRPAPRTRTPRSGCSAICRRPLGGAASAQTISLTQGLGGGGASLGITLHVAQYVRPRGGSAIDARTTRHAGYGVGQRIRKLIEQVFGWMKAVGVFRKLRHRGRRLVAWTFTFSAAACNLVR